MFKDANNFDIINNAIYLQEPFRHPVVVRVEGKTLRIGSPSTAPDNFFAYTDSEGLPIASYIARTLVRPSHIERAKIKRAIQIEQENIYNGMKNLESIGLTAPNPVQEHPFGEWAKSPLPYP